MPEHPPILNYIQCGACDLIVMWDAEHDEEPKGWQSFSGYGMHCPDCAIEMKQFYQEANEFFRQQAEEEPTCPT